MWPRNAFDGVNVKISDADYAPYQEPDDPNLVPWDPVANAQEYARNALFNLAQYHYELRQFKAKHGGMWLLSSHEVESRVVDAIYRIGWHNDFHYDEEAFMRRCIAESRDQEEDQFWKVSELSAIGVSMTRRWQDLVRDGATADNDEQKAATHAWLIIAACKEYCDLVDDDWAKIADWYRPGTKPLRGIQSIDLFQEYVARRGLD